MEVAQLVQFHKQFLANIFDFSFQSCVRSTHLVFKKGVRIECKQLLLQIVLVKVSETLFVLSKVHLVSIFLSLVGLSPEHRVIE